MPVLANLNFQYNYSSLQCHIILSQTQEERERFRDTVFIKK